MAKFIIEKIIETGDLIFNGSVSMADIQGLKLDRLDSLLLSEPMAAPEDALLALEMIFRRINEQKRNNDIQS